MMQRGMYISDAVAGSKNAAQQRQLQQRRRQAADTVSRYIQLANTAPIGYTSGYASDAATVRSR
jgi:hypothetical protein